MFSPDYHPNVDTTEFLPPDASLAGALNYWGIAEQSPMQKSWEDRFPDELLTPPSHQECQEKKEKEKERKKEKKTRRKKKRVTEKDAPARRRTTPSIPHAPPAKQPRYVTPGPPLGQAPTSGLDHEPPAASDQIASPTTPSAQTASPDASRHDARLPIASTPSTQTASSDASRHDARPPIASRPSTPAAKTTSPDASRHDARLPIASTPSAQTASSDASRHDAQPPIASRPSTPAAKITSPDASRCDAKPPIASTPSAQTASSDASRPSTPAAQTTSADASRCDAQPPIASTPSAQTASSDASRHDSQPPIASRPSTPAAQTASPDASRCDAQPPIASTPSAQTASSKSSRHDAQPPIAATNSASPPNPLAVYFSAISDMGSPSIPSTSSRPASVVAIKPATSAHVPASASNHTRPASVVIIEPDASAHVPTPTQPAPTATPAPKKKKIKQVAPLQATTVPPHQQKRTLLIPAKPLLNKEQRAKQTKQTNRKRKHVKKFYIPILESKPKSKELTTKQQNHASRTQRTKIVEYERNSALTAISDVQRQMWKLECLSRRNGWQSSLDAMIKCQKDWSKAVTASAFYIVALRKVMVASVKRGALIVFEGCDRCGKSTQTKLLVDALIKQGHSAKLLRFPDRTTVIGQIIDQYLKQSRDLSDQAIHLLFSANRWEVEKSMIDDLSNGTTLVVDRYAYSGIAFSAAKGLNFEWCKQSDVGLPAPDVLFFLNLAPEEALKRGGFGEERYERLEMQKTVYEMYKKLREPSWNLIDASNPVVSVFEKVLSLSKKTLATIGNSEIGRLWMED